MADIPEITLQTTSILEIAGVQISNSVLATLGVSLVIIVMGIVLKRQIKVVPGKFQVAMETFVDVFMTQLKAAWGSEERAARYLPIILTLFLFLLIANQFSVIPLVSSVVADGASALRTPSSDLGLTVALAVAVIVSAHVIAFAQHPIRHLGNYFKFHEFLKVRSFGDLFSASLDFFLGLLDIIGELAKVISLACRLFGNIFAGEVMIAVMTGLITYVIPMPFIAISIFSGIVQAFVFALLSVQYMAGIVQSAEPQTT